MATSIFLHAFWTQVKESCQEDHVQVRDLYVCVQTSATLSAVHQSHGLHGPFYYYTRLLLLYVHIRMRVRKQDVRSGCPGVATSASKQPQCTYPWFPLSLFADRAWTRLITGCWDLPKVIGHPRHKLPCWQNWPSTLLL